MFTMLPVLEHFLYRSTLNGDEEEEVEDIFTEDEDENEQDDEDENEQDDEDEEYDCDDPNDEDYEPSEQEDDEDEEEDDDVQDDDVQEDDADEQSSKEQDIPSIYQTTTINLLVNFHRIVSQFQVWWMQLNKSNVWKNVCENAWTNALYTFSQNVYDSAMNLFTFCKTEPPGVAWICESSLVINQHTVRLELIEKYYQDKYTQQFENMCTGMQDAVDHFSYMHYNVKENLIIYKFAEDGYMSRTFIKGNTAPIKDDLATGPCLANVRFLSIQYNHPLMKEPLFLNIPRGMYYCGNQILSAAHVFRLLQYQSADYVFDTQYTLLLLDQDVNESCLSSLQYICVEKDQFVVCTVQV